MFEDSLFASGVSLDQRRNAGRTRWIATASVAIQGLVLGAFIAVPMIWPERLPLVSITPKLSSISLKKPEVKVEPKPVRVEATDAAYHPPSQAQTMTESRGASLIHTIDGIVHAGEVEPSLGVGFREEMLSWPAGRRQTDGVWAPAWYDAVERSTGFAAPRPPITLNDLDPALRPIAESARPLYEKLAAMKLSPPPRGRGTPKGWRGYEPGRESTD